MSLHPQPMAQHSPLSPCLMAAWYMAGLCGDPDIFPLPRPFSFREPRPVSQVLRCLSTISSISQKIVPVPLETVPVAGSERVI